MASSWTRKSLNFFRDESGPTAVEYAVMLALIIAVCVAAVSVLGLNAYETFDKVYDTLAGDPW
jgi:pilus assembly protein Flp/PilA